MSIHIEKLDKIRRNAGLLTVGEILQLHDRGNIIMDPFSLIISRDIIIGEENIFYPNVVLQAIDLGKINVANGNKFYMNTFIYAEQGTVDIGNKNQFGDGGCTIKANSENAAIVINDHGRYINGPLIIGSSQLGSGTQVIGSVTVQNSTLEGGGNYTFPDPDERGAVLKGTGLARGILVSRGKVINAYGNFQDAQIEDQSTYHPKK